MLIFDVTIFSIYSTLFVIKTTYKSYKKQDIIINNIIVVQPDNDMKSRNNNYNGCKKFKNIKKLSKIKLQDAEILESKEMKTVLGGSGTNSCGTNPYYCQSGKSCVTAIGTSGRCGLHFLSGTPYCACIESYY